MWGKLASGQGIPVYKHDCANGEQKKAEGEEEREAMIDWTVPI